MTDDLLPLPDVPWTRAALDLVLECEPLPLANHSLRSFAFARVLAEHEGIDTDPALLFAATVLHDLGLRADADAPVRFEVDGADRAAEFLTGHGVAAADVDQVWEAIALHCSAGIAERRGPLAYLTREGVGLDFGRGAAFVGQAFADRLHAAYPRLHMVRSLVDAIVEQVRRVPERGPRYSIGAELTRQRSTAPFETEMERDVPASRWGA